jgi:hypothetical protein
VSEQGKRIRRAKANRARGRALAKRGSFPADGVSRVAWPCSAYLVKRQALSRSAEVFLHTQIVLATRRVAGASLRSAPERSPARWGILPSHPSVEAVKKVLPILLEPQNSSLRTMPVSTVPGSLEPFPTLLVVFGWFFRSRQADEE